MEDTPQLGMNRTGIQMSPFDIEEMVKDAEKTVPAPGDESAMADLRGEYIADADPLGSVPVPGTVKGMVKSGMEMLSGNRPQVFIDKLGERLAFERTGTRLYEALIAKCRAVSGAGVASLDMLIRFHDEEAKHFELLANALEALGADPTAQTPSADLAGIESMGLVQALSDPRTSMVDCLHAILVAELVDNAAWEVLIRLAEDLDQDDLASQFRLAVREEGEHLATIRAWYEQATLALAGVKDQPQA